LTTLMFDGCVYEINSRYSLCVKLFFVRISVFAYKIMVTVLASISVDVVFIPRQLKPNSIQLVLLLHCLARSMKGKKQRLVDSESG
jgi:hypothetical protein